MWSVHLTGMYHMSFILTWPLISHGPLERHSHFQRCKTLPELLQSSRAQNLLPSLLLVESLFTVQSCKFRAWVIQSKTLGFAHLRRFGLVCTIFRRFVKRRDIQTLTRSRGRGAPAAVNRVCPAVCRRCPRRPWFSARITWNLYTKFLGRSRYQTLPSSWQQQVISHQAFCISTFSLVPMEDSWHQTCLSRQFILLDIQTNNLSVVQCLSNIFWFFAPWWSNDVLSF